MNIKTFKEMYKEELQIPAETKLLEQYNSILNKTEDDITDSDVCFMLRQNLFLDFAIPKAISLIKEKPNRGDSYDFQMLINLSETNINIYLYRDSINNLVSFLSNNYSNILFELESDRTDFNKAVNKLRRF